MADRWFYAVGEERRGPVERDELLRMIAEGKLRRTALVWTRSPTDWAPAGEVAELSGAPWPEAFKPIKKKVVSFPDAPPGTASRPERVPTP